MLEQKIHNKSNTIYLNTAMCKSDYEYIRLKLIFPL